jgi:predicted Co/Zn/Cd cation transporter (cation efflux family)
LSVCGYAGMAIAGLAFAWLTQSGAILLDGAFSFVSVIMALLAMQVAKLLNQYESPSFQFGYANFEPLLNTIRGLLILVIVTLGVGTAVMAILRGGRELNASLAVVYSVIIATICLIMAYTQQRFARQTSSPLLRLDARNWLIDAILTFAVGIAFVGTLILSWTPWSFLTPYVDPIVVVILGTVMFPVPLRIVLRSVRELLYAAPASAVQTAVRTRVGEATSELPLQQCDVRMVRVGRYFYVLVRLVTQPEFRVDSIAELDTIRERIASALADIEQPQTLLDVVFTEDPRWIVGHVRHPASPETLTPQADTSSTSPSTAPTVKPSPPPPE